MESYEYHQDGMIHDTGNDKMRSCGEPPSLSRPGVTIVQQLLNYASCYCGVVSDVYLIKVCFSVRLR